MKRIQFPDLVIVEWGDAWTSGKWSDDDSSNEPVQVVTIGWVEKQDKKGITVVGRICNDDGELGTGVRSFIPAGMITKITKVKHSAILWSRR